MQNPEITNLRSRMGRTIFDINKLFSMKPEIPKRACSNPESNITMQQPKLKRASTDLTLSSRNNSGSEVQLHHFEEVVLGNYDEDEVKEDISEEGYKYFGRVNTELVFKELSVDINHGLSTIKVLENRERYGKNELEQDPPVPIWKLMLYQLKDLMNVMLLIGALISIALGEYETGGVIIVGLTAIIYTGASQEKKGSDAVESLRNMTGSSAKVIRRGKRLEIPVKDLVVGDVLILETGDKIGVDARMIEIHELSVDEATATGESIPVPKLSYQDAKEKCEANSDTNPERYTMVWSGTSVAEGHGIGVVTEVGTGTRYLGTINKMLNDAGMGSSPLQDKLDDLAETFGKLSIAAGIVTAIIMICYGVNWLTILLVVVALIVAAVPEGLPAAVTITLAFGMKKLANINVIIRRLSSVETCGSVQKIYSDKTGTLTTGKMTARGARTSFLGEQEEFEEWTISGVGCDLNGNFSLNATTSIISEKSCDLLFTAASLCSNATIEFNDVEQKW